MRWHDSTIGLLEAACDAVGADPEEAQRQNGKSRDCARARRICWYIMSARGWRVVDIQELTGCNHSTVINAVRRVTPEDREIAARIEDLMDERPSPSRGVVVRSREAMELQRRERLHAQITQRWRALWIGGAA